MGIIAETFEFDLMSILGDVNNKEWGMGIKEVDSKSYDSPTYEFLWSLGFGQMPGTAQGKSKYIQANEISPGGHEDVWSMASGSQIADNLFLKHSAGANTVPGRMVNSEFLFDDTGAVSDPGNLKDETVDNFWDSLPIEAYEHGYGDRGDPIWIKSNDESNTIPKERLCHVCQNMAEPEQGLDYNILPICQQCKKGHRVKANIKISPYNIHSRKQLGEFEQLAGH